MIVTRFAPSPTGQLHLGHAFAAITACEAGERFLLRIENIDAARCRPEYEKAIVEDLTWLGLRFEQPVLRQSSRMNAYRAALAVLNARGLLYPCFCTRKDIADEIARSASAPHGPDGLIYPGLCRSLDGKERARRIANGEVYALRLDAAKAAASAGPLFFEERGRGRTAVDPFLFGDSVLARKDTPAAYHLAVVVDDAFQGVTLVTRGSDLFASTHVQRLLQALLGLPAPAYAHHTLILDENGRKFSKRDRAVTLRALRESGLTPEDIRIRLPR
ncbi:MAG: tRNA glutamyl-Q(34) synthetase GluQRS [Alphaproteobacteria bacterium]|nr:tRNA glutamyl-Q(34) synthetase GluQRS [Alphaproteobacteria bacterium]MDE2629813.1 tRNA glutamyl-Q(34) synthetase GluQRS [Alphaproteobacteria bacterium]